MDKRESRRSRRSSRKSREIDNDKRSRDDAERKGSSNRQSDRDDRSRSVENSNEDSSSSRSLDADSLESMMKELDKSSSSDNRDNRDNIDNMDDKKEEVDVGKKVDALQKMLEEKEGKDERPNISITVQPMDANENNENNDSTNVVPSGIVAPTETITSSGTVAPTSVVQTGDNTPANANMNTNIAGTPGNYSNLAVAPQSSKMGTITWIAVALCVLGMGGTAYYTYYQISNLPSDLSEPELRMRKSKLITMGVMLSMVLAWPLIYHMFMGLDTLSKFPIAIFGFAWPILLTISDILSRKDEPFEYDNLGNTRKDEDQRGSPTDFSDGKLGNEAMAIITLIFAMGTLLVHTLTPFQLMYTVPALKWALLLGVAFVIPDTYQDPGSTVGAIIQSVKKSMFNMAVGMVITGIALDVMFTNKKRETIQMHELESNGQFGVYGRSKTQKMLSS